MTFLWPAMLIGLLALPLFVLTYVRLQQRRRSLVAAYGDIGLVQGSGARRLGTRRHLPPMLFLLALVILTFALARPQALVNLPRMEGTVILAFDVSGSMGADDMKPTRLDAAKAAAREFVQRQPGGVEVGVVSFSDA